MDFIFQKVLLIFEANTDTMLYKGVLHTHITIVAIYIILFLIKVIYLLAGNQEALAKFRKKTKVIGEMVLPTLFLLSGIYLAIKSPFAGETWFIVKMVLIALSIVLGIITFRKNNKFLGILTLLIFIYIFSLSYTKSPDLQKHTEMVAVPENSAEKSVNDGTGKAIYESTCISCHGADGTAGLAGAANLQKTTLGEDEIITVITNGKNNMPSFGQLSEKDRRAVAEYVMRLGK